MKRTILIAATSLISLLPFSSAQRLPQVAVPENYQLAFTPDLAKASFGGDETIQIRVFQPTSQITLNSAEIEFHLVQITAAGSTQTAKVSLDKEKEQATLSVERPLAAGPATVHIVYSGNLNNELRGFYLGKDSDGRKYAATQFEATDARRAFPCFDEPAYKATFDVTVTADKNLTVISNMKAISDTPSQTEKHTVRFATTPKMSSYLVAMVVGEFEYIEGSADGIPIRIYTHPGKKQLAQFGLEVAENSMRYYNRYFDIKYPYGKLDIIGLADFSAGAMENTGCITSREVALLVDANAPVDLKKEVAITVAHEMAHQWFGDLVTMQWWDDIWLNEGFATWMSSKPLEAWKPEWNMHLDDLNDTVQAMNADSLLNTHPIHQEAQTPQEILELAAPAITYAKTAAVLRMLESYLGPDTFRAGVNAYLKKHAYANATSADFWDAQSQVSKQPVDKIMGAFIDQPGVPMLRVSAECSSGSEKVSATQQRYFFDREKFESGSSEVWQIPACLKAGPSADIDCTLISQKQQDVKLKSCSPWVFANAGARGYYHSSYSPEAARALAQDAETTLDAGERIMLLADVWASVRVDQEKIGDFLAVLEGMHTERNAAVLAQMIVQLDYIGRYLVSDADRESYQMFVRRLLTPIAKSVGWEPKAGENVEMESLRAELMHALGYTARDPETVALARQLTQKALTDPSSVNRELAFASLEVAATNGDEVLYNRLMEGLKTAKTPERIYTFYNALASFGDPALLEKVLDFALSPAVRSQDAVHLIGRVMRNPEGQKVAWEFVRSHWNEIQSSGGAFAGGALAGPTGTFCDAAMRDEVKQFFATHHEPASERTLKQSLERMNYCVDMKQQQSGQLASWLRSQGPSSSTSGAGTR